MKAQKEKWVPGYSVKAACKRLGIGPHTLRAWESRYQAVQPARSEKGQRLYSDRDVERLERIVGLVNLGHSIGVVARLSDKELTQLLNTPLPVKKKTEAESECFGSILEVFEKDLRQFNIHAIASLLDQRRNTLGARGFVLEVLGPLIRWIGGKIENKDLSIAHEHALSAVVRDQIYQTLRYGTAPVPSETLPCFVLATPEDDLHEFGILMSAALLSHHGVPGHLMGANLPASALAIAVKAVRGNVIVLGNSPVPESERSISVEDYLRELHRLVPKEVAIWIGGRGKIPHLRSVLPGREHRFIGSLHELDARIEKISNRKLGVSG